MARKALKKGILIEPEIKENERGNIRAVFRMRITEGTHADPLFYSSPRLRDVFGKKSPS